MTIKDIEIFNKDNNLDALTLLLVVTFTPIFIAQLIFIRLCRCTTFDEKILPSHWSSNTHQVIKKMMEDLLRLKKTLESAIQSLKYSLPMSHLPEQQNELIQALIRAAEQFKNIQDSTHPFTRYLKKEDRYIIKALITSEQLAKSLTELLTSQAYLEYSLNQQKNDA